MFMKYLQFIWLAEMYRTKLNLYFLHLWTVVTTGVKHKRREVISETYYGGG